MHGENALPRLTRRTALAAIGFGSASVVLGGRALASATTSGEVVDLGAPMRTVNVRIATAGTLPDGTPVIFAFSDGNPVSFNVVRVDTGAVIDAFELGPDTVGSSLVQHPDGSVYFSIRAPSVGRLLRYVPATHEVQTVATNVVSQAMLRTLVVDPSTGIVYGSTYPSTKVFSYDPSTGVIRDYGRMVSDGSYAWGFDLVGDKLWVGTGIGTAHLIELDPASGAKTEITLPDAFSGSTYIYSIRSHGDVVLVVLAPGVGNVNTLVYNTVTRSWDYEDSVHQGISLNGLTSDLDSQGSFYYISSGEIYAYDTTTHTSSPIGFAASNLAERISDTRSVDVMESGGSREIVGIQNVGDVWRYDLATRTGTAVDNQIVGSPATLHSLGVGPDDQIYVGAYLSSGVMAKASPTTYQVEQLKGPKQADTIYSHRGRIVVTSYPNAVASIGSGSPWNWGTNPAELFSLGRFSEHEQDRIFDVTSVGAMLVFGTVPNYGELGGAIVHADLDGNVEVFRNVVQDQSISALASRGTTVYAGSSIYGGLSSTPTAVNGVFFGWDTRNREKLFQVTPVPGAKVIHTLMIHESSVWGLSSTGVLFEFDMRTRSVVRTVDIGLPDSNSWGRSTALYYRSQDEQFYGNSGGKLFRIDPATLRTTVLLSNVKVSTLAPTGDIFFGDSNKLYVYKP